MQAPFKRLGFSFYIAAMKSAAFLFFIFSLVHFSCNNSDKKDQKAENDLDAARQFIRAALDGDFDKAETLLLPDSINQSYLEQIERNYKERMSNQDKANYKAASIRILEDKELNDSTHIIYYSNSYKNKKDSLRSVRVNGDWLIDLKYIFKYKTDSL